MSGTSYPGTRCCVPQTQGWHCCESLQNSKGYITLINKSCFLSCIIRGQFILCQQESAYVILTKASLHPIKMQVIAVPSVAVLSIELFTAFRRRSYTNIDTYSEGWGVLALTGWITFCCVESSLSHFCSHYCFFHMASLQQAINWEQ